MKQCPKCKTEHNKPGVFCSRKCANSRTWSEEDKLKKSISAKNSEKAIASRVGFSKKCENWHKEGIYQNVPDKIKEGWVIKHSKEIQKVKEENILKVKELEARDFNILSKEEKRKRVMFEQNYVCLECSLKFWNNKPLVLELDHIDGNNKNDERDNLRFLCPNCHSQTETWRGRKKRKNEFNKIKITDETLLNSLNKNINIRQALLDVGLVAKGGNYKRCEKLLELYS